MTKWTLILLGALLLTGCGSQTPTDPAAPSTEGLLTNKERVELHLPATGKLTLATEEDQKRTGKLPAEVGSAVGAFLKTRAVEWKIMAARPVGNHILLWIAFPKIADGGIDLIYSVEKKRIVGEFLGGQRG
jgi:hypothetical protein